MKKDRRGEILDIAAELFAVRGVAGTTVREIADRVGILSGSLYHHFDSKDAIVQEIVLDYLADIEQRYHAAAAAADDSATELALLIQASLEASVARPHATELYQNNHAYFASLPKASEIQAAAARVQKVWLDTINAGVAAGVFRDDIPPAVFYRMIRDAVWLSVRWYNPKGRFSTRQMADACTKLFLEGFLNRA
ncbi:TetR family transcriptional regulator [Enemella dayhoffiae]|uniref:TetR family transcriptional regulator n=1 Tax=Enemella dayhoffiae TaxID=2016507 RepID=A0A255GL49_9ACTN|nr:TetR/AcrR family transcriptional regulator [Enemella dayhoffiae]OYO16540.1 TetR family transcriptional regulator [Enemella dayhoffiae]